MTYIMQVVRLFNYFKTSTVKKNQNINNFYYCLLPMSVSGVSTLLIGTVMQLQ